MPESMGGSSKQKLVFKPVSSNPIENPSTLKFAIKENQWDYVLKYIFDEEEVPSEFWNIFLTDPDIAWTIFQKGFCKIQK